jgi:hypothetical protein
MRRITLLLLAAAAFHPATAAQPAMSGPMTAAWSLDGQWTGVSADETTGVIHALGRDRVGEIDVEGHIRHESPLPLSVARLLRLGTVPRVLLVGFAEWGVDGVVAHGVRGERLWSYVVPEAPDDVWVADLDGDKTDEIVVGYNARGGVQVLDGQGRLRWKSTVIGNVWKVAAGDVLGRGTPQVVTTSAAGTIHIFNGADGADHAEIAPPRLYADVVRVKRLDPGDAAATILAAGINQDTGASAAIALSGSGAVKWRVAFAGKVHTAAVASSRPWLALGTREGEVLVVDAARGDVIGLVSGQERAEVGWAVDPPLLLVATGKALNAFRVDVN